MPDPWHIMACISIGALVFCYYWLLDVRGTANLLGKKVLDRLDAIEMHLEPKKQPERPEHYHIEVYECSDGTWGFNIMYHATDKTGSYAMRWDADAKGFKSYGYDSKHKAWAFACVALDALKEEDAKFYGDEDQ